METKKLNGQYSLEEFMALPQFSKEEYEKSLERLKSNPPPPTDDMPTTTFLANLIHSHAHILAIDKAIGEDILVTLDDDIANERKIEISSKMSRFLIYKMFKNMVIALSELKRDVPQELKEESKKQITDILEQVINQDVIMGFILLRTIMDVADQIVDREFAIFMKEEAKEQIVIVKGDASIAQA